jgi:Leucine-rich repeat (LRR) protein
MEHVLGDLDGKTDVLRWIVGFLRFRDWQALSSCSCALAASDLRRFVFSQGVLRVPPPPLTAENAKLPAASYYADSFLRRMSPEMLRCITTIKVPRTGMHLLSLLRALPALHSLRFWDYPYWTPEEDAAEDEEPAINVAAVLQLLPFLQELNVSDADVTLAELLDVPQEHGLVQLRALDLAETDVPQEHGLVQLRALDLAETDVVDLTPLVVLPQLQSLSVRRTNVASLAVLEALPKLHVLDVSETRVVEFGALRALQQLETLDMSKNWVTTDLRVLQNLPALRSLKATNIGASDALELRLNCPELEILHLQNTRLTDLEFVSALPNLTFLDIRWTHVGDRRPLAALESLEQLLVDTRERGAPLGDETEDLLPAPAVNYEWLRGLRKLKKLRMYKHNYQDDIADVLREDVVEQGATVVSSRGLTIPMAHRVPGSFLRCVSSEGALTSLELPPLTDYSPLTLMSTTLRHLRLQQWCSEDLAQILALGELPALTRLSMSLPPTAQVMDLLPLEGYVQLKQLELLDVLFEDLSPLGALVHLEKLVLSLPDRGKRQLARRHKDHQTTFEFLPQLTRLEELSLIGRVDFKDAALLSGMHKMRRLWLNATKVEDAAPLASLARLEMLDLGLTPMTTVEGLGRLLELQSIWVPEAVDCKPLRDARNFPRLYSIWHPDDYNCLWTDHKF